MLSYRTSPHLTYDKAGAADDVAEAGPEPEPMNVTLHEHQKDGLRWMLRMYDNGMPLVLVSSPASCGAVPTARWAAARRHYSTSLTLCLIEGIMYM